MINPSDDTAAILEISYITHVSLQLRHTFVLWCVKDDTEMAMHLLRFNWVVGLQEKNQTHGKCKSITQRHFIRKNSDSYTVCHHSPMKHEKRVCPHIDDCNFLL